jgi:hypothetical protein
MIDNNVWFAMPELTCPNCGAPMRMFGVERHDGLDDMALRSHECVVCKTVRTDAVPVAQSGAGVSESPFTALAHGQGFDDENLSLLGAAFDAAWKVVQDSGSPLAAEPDRSNTRELLAKYILVAGRRRKRDPKQLVEQALGYLTQSGSSDFSPATARANAKFVNGSAAAMPKKGFA